MATVVVTCLIYVDPRLHVLLERVGIEQIANVKKIVI